MRRSLLLLALLAAAAPAAARARRTAPPSVLEIKRPPQPEWFGVYLMGRKAGWAWTSVKVEARDGQRVLVAHEQLTIQAEMGARQVRRTIDAEKVYEARPGGRLLAFTVRNAGDGGDRLIEGRCTAERCSAELTAGGDRRALDLPPFHETVEQADAARLAAARRGTVTGEQLDVVELRVKHMQDRYAGTAKVAAGGVQTAVAVVEEQEEGDRASQRVELAPDGRVVEIRFGDTLQRPEAEDEAKRVDGSVDVLDTARVRLPGPLRPEIPGRAVFRLRGVPKAFQVSDPRQAWSDAGADEVTLTVSARRPAAADPARDAPRTQAAQGAPPELRDLLAPTPQVDSDAPAIQKLAREVVGDTRGVYAASVKLERFVFERLEKAYGVSRDRATDVLALGKGDCTEHALLFTALARAAGIPARQVQGLVYARYDDGVPALYWHAWVEVRSGDEWIALDPTFGQAVADPSHVALGRGATRPGESLRADTLAVLGTLKVVSAESRPGV